MNYPHPFLAKEGWPFIAIAFFIAIFASIFFPGWFALLFWLLLAFVVQFFRDPPRPVPLLPGAVLAPADGRIVKVETTRDPYADRDALLISVFMNVFNVHSNRISVDGTVRSVQYFPGQFLNADLDKASTHNERNAVVIDGAGELSGQTITLVQVAGLVARRILCYVRAGATVERGERYGFIRFGSRVDVYLPLHAVPQVVPGQKVSATSTVLALVLPQDTTAETAAAAPGADAASTDPAESAGT
ncbi:phosphatidylserine decarboxylase [Amphibiibacter pelophylacis]|uniref:Phosphatidylserine decarboxylase n=1 Tax=Amphibiibacter pelophylacis TaxID=1799477 RepID=A0ACC6NYR0_9BURK